MGVFKGLQGGKVFPMKILFADDDFLMKVFVDLLEKWGHSVVYATDGTAALELFTINPGIELVITDFEMPGMNGLELTKELKLRAPEIRIWVSSGSFSCAKNDLTLEGVGKELREAGAEKVLSKMWLNRVAKEELKP